MATATTTYEFTDLSSVGRRPRRASRSHAVKARNVRRSLLRAPRVGIKPLDDIQIAEIVQKYEGIVPKSVPSTQAVPEHQRVVNNVSPKLVPQVGSDLSGLSSACEMTPHSRRVVRDFLGFVGDSLHASGSCKAKPDPHMAAWFQYMLTDQAYFHCFVALSEACINFVTGNDSLSSEHRHHVATAIHLINENLCGAQAVADANMASVVAICLLSTVRQQPQQTKVHFDGLCRMIELRGGMHELNGNPAIVEKAHRIDIDLALQLGCPARLGRSVKTLDAIVPIFANPNWEVRSPLVNAVRNASGDVCEAVKDVVKVSRLFNSGVAARKLGPHAFHDLITTMCYGLVEIGPIDSALAGMHPVANATHLALMAFMTTFLIQLGRERRLSYELLSRKLKEALEHPAFQAGVDPATHLWLLVIGGISVFTQADQAWLKPRITEAVGQFGISDWQFARRLLGKYPWVSDLHDQPARQLWESCFTPSIDLARGGL